MQAKNMIGIFKSFFKHLRVDQSKVVMRSKTFFSRTSQFTDYVYALQKVIMRTDSRTFVLAFKNRMNIQEK